jgi:hypothetical protein
MQQLNDELDVSIGWHTWQFLRKNIWVVLNNSRDVPFTWLSTLNWLAKIVATNSIVVQSSLVNRMAHLAHKITLSNFLNQSMPIIMSMPLESMMMRFNKKSNPL